MSFFVNWWLGYRRRQHRRSFVPFAVVGVVCSVILFFGAYELLTQAPLSVAIGHRPIVSLPSAKPPDFVALLPGVAGEDGRSIVRLPDDRVESYVVGYRSAQGPAVGLVTKGLMGYTVKANLLLPGGGDPAPSGYPAVYLWPSAGADQRVLAVMPQTNLQRVAYVFLANGQQLQLVERQTPMSDVPPQYIMVGDLGDARRIARFGDLDGDGLPDDLMIEIRQGSQPPHYEAYTLRDGQLTWRQDLVDTLRQTTALFDDPGANLDEMIIIEGVGPAAAPTIVTNHS